MNEAVCTYLSKYIVNFYFKFLLNNYYRLIFMIKQFKSIPIQKRIVAKAKLYSN